MNDKSCCESWEITEETNDRHTRGYWYDGLWKPFHYCPWCGSKKVSLTYIRDVAENVIRHRRKDMVKFCAALDELEKSIL